MKWVRLKVGFWKQKWAVSKLLNNGGNRRNLQMSVYCAFCFFVRVTPEENSGRERKSRSKKSLVKYSVVKKPGSGRSASRCKKENSSIAQFAIV